MVSAAVVGVWFNFWLQSAPNPCCDGMFAARNYEASQCGRLFGKDSKKFVTTWPCVRKERMKGGNRDSLAMPKRSSEFKRETAPEKNNVNFTGYQYMSPKNMLRCASFSIWMSVHLVWHVRSA